jgi:hypothetical protein
MSTARPCASTPAKVAAPQWTVLLVLTGERHGH